MEKKSSQSGAAETVTLALSALTCQKLGELQRALGKASLAEVAADAVEWYIRFRSAPAVEVLDQLTPRLRQVLQLIGEGHTSKEIAAKLGISIKTVEMHRTHLMKTLHIHGVADLVRFSIRTGLVNLED